MGEHSASMESLIYAFKQAYHCLYFESNKASGRGGAVYVEDSDYTPFEDMTRCFEFGYSGDYTWTGKYGNITIYIFWQKFCEHSRKQHIIIWRMD